MSILPGEKEVIIAVLGSSHAEGFLRVYRKVLGADGSEGGQPSLLVSSAHARNTNKLYHEVRACRENVAATVLHFANVVLPPKYEIILINTNTGQETSFLNTPNSASS